MIVGKKGFVMGPFFLDSLSPLGPPPPTQATQTAGGSTPEVSL